MRALALLLLTAPLAAQELRARFVDEDGAPLTDVVVGGRPVDGQGRIELPVPGSGAGTSVRVTATAPGRVEALWFVGCVGWPLDGDVGEVTLPRTASLVGRIVTPEGEVLTSGWSVSAASLWAPPSGSRVIREGVVDQGSGEFRIEGLPSGGVNVRGEHVTEVATSRVQVELESEQERFVEVPFSGEDPRRRLTVRLAAPAVAGPHRVELVLVDGDGARHVQETIVRAGHGACLFSGLGPGPFTVEVQVGAFAGQVLRRVPGGQELTVELAGSAALDLEVVDAAGARVEAWALGVEGASAPGGSPEPRPASRLLGALPPGRTMFRLHLGADQLLFEGPDLRPGERVRHRLVLPPRFDVRLRLLDADGEPWPGAEARLRPLSIGGERVGTAGPDGVASLRGLYADDYRAEVTWSPLVTTEHAVRVASDAPLELAAPGCGSLTLTADLGREPPRADLLLRVDGGPVVPLEATVDLGAVRAGARRLELLVREQGSSATDRVHAEGLGTVIVEHGVAATRHLDVASRLPAQVTVLARVDGVPERSFTLERTLVVDVASPWSLEARDLTFAGLSRANFLLAPGRYRLGLAGRDGTWAVPLGEGILSLEPGARLDLEVDVARVRRRVRLLGPDGEAPSPGRVDVDLSSAGVAAGQRRSFGPSGELDLRCSAGTVRFSLVGSRSRATLEWSDELPERVEVRLQEP